ncbi:MAG TPA: hypothetical protein VFW78_06400 [Bacteroidia bacterium]|nr:hypothetical protein [Bacteroidia bacterium]
MFNGAHIHLLLNHVPILGPFFILPLLLYGVIRKNSVMDVAGLLLTVAVAAVTIPAYLTGEEAEDAVEDIIGVSKSAIHDHEEQAEIAYYAMLMAGALALGTLLPVFKQKQVSFALVWAVIAVLAVTLLLMTRTGNSGGKIRHSEISRTINESNSGEHDD